VTPMPEGDVLYQFDAQRRFRRQVVNGVAVAFNIVLLAAFGALLVVSWNSETGNPDQQASAPANPTLEMTAPIQSSPSALQNDGPLADLPMIRPTPADPTALIGQMLSGPMGQSDLVPLPDQTFAPRVKTVPVPASDLDRHVAIDNKKQNGSENASVKKHEEAANKAPQATQEPKPNATESLAAEIERRRMAALDLERSYATSGVTISAHVSGANGTVLNMEYQFNDALVQKIVGVPTFKETLGELGFRMIVFTGTQGKTWSFPLQTKPQEKPAKTPN
jgi:hypothetical protein